MTMSVSGAEPAMLLDLLCVRQFQDQYLSAIRDTRLKSLKSCNGVRKCWKLTGTKVHLRRMAMSLHDFKRMS